MQSTLTIPYTVTYGICPVIRLQSKAGQPVPIAVYLCGAGGANRSTGAAVTVLSLDGGKAPHNQLTGTTAFSGAVEGAQ